MGDVAETLVDLEPLGVALVAVLGAVPVGPGPVIGEALSALLQATVKIATAAIGAERVRAIVDAELSAVDVAVDAYEARKFPR